MIPESDLTQASMAHAFARSHWPGLVPNAGIGESRTGGLPRPGRIRSRRFPSGIQCSRSGFLQGEAAPVARIARKRNPGQGLPLLTPSANVDRLIPDYAALHPGYGQPLSAASNNALVCAKRIFPVPPQRGSDGC